jgi:hypothetical protein
MTVSVNALAASPHHYLRCRGRSGAIDRRRQGSSPQTSPNQTMNVVPFAFCSFVSRRLRDDDVCGRSPDCFSKSALDRPTMAQGSPLDRHIALVQPLDLSAVTMSDTPCARLTPRGKPISTTLVPSLSEPWEGKVTLITMTSPVGSGSIAEVGGYESPPSNEQPVSEAVTTRDTIQAPARRVRFLYGPCKFLLDQENETVSRQPVVVLAG